MKQCSGGVCAAKGFTAAGIRCGVKKSALSDGNQPLCVGGELSSYLTGKKDLALIMSQRECTAAGVYTMNRVKAAPVYVTMSHLENGTAWGIVANSGNANACAPQSHENAEAMCRLAAQATGREAEDFIVCSTGVIGQPLNLPAIEAGLPIVAGRLSRDGSDDAAHAIMTTDTEKKELAYSFTVGGKTVTLGGICKGSGMIHPNMGTMLCFLTTDCAITADLLHQALSDVVKKTFNRVSVDGDTSTNDTCVILANGMADNPLIEWKDADYAVFCNALESLCKDLAKRIARDGEGATRLITCRVSGSRNEEAAERLAMAVICSPLVKAAMFGADANMGRILCAMGYSKAPFRPEYVDIRYLSPAGSILVCEKGTGLDFDEALAKTILTQDEVTIDISLHEGDASAEAYGCDLTYDYVKINGDYRT